jgi:hypothetical protein
MSWSGGTYTKGNAATGGWTGDAAGGIGIEAGRHDTQDNDFQNGINNCLTKDGQNTPTANLPMGGFKHTGVGSATANDQYTAWAQLRNGTPVYIDTVNSRLGVGTNAPSQKLSVEGNVTAGSTTVAGNYSLKIGSGTASTTNLARYSGANGVGEIRHQGTGTFQIAIEDAASFRVDTNATQRFLIDSAGQVEVGDGTAAAPAISFLSDTNTGIYRIGTDTIGIATAGVEKARISGAGVLGINDTANISYHLRVRSTTNTGITGAARFATDYSGDVSSVPVLIEKYDATNTTSQILARFNIGLGSTPSGSGQIVANGANQAAFGTYSDVSLKENIEPLGDELANICALNPVEFDYKNGSGHQIGFVAQEVQQVYPDLVSPDENGLLMLADLSKNDARMIRAIQQLAERVAALEAQLEAQTEIL